jgi:hypothetical protein
VSVGDTGFAYTFSDGILRRSVVLLSPYSEADGVPARLTSFKEGVLYTLRAELPASRPLPLFLMKDPEEGGLLVTAFRDKQVRDIVVRGDECYVLTSATSAEGYECGLHRSSDLSGWTQIAAFTTPAVAWSLEELDGTFYVGLACPGSEPNPMSGRICRLGDDSKVEIRPAERSEFLSSVRPGRL